jgi:ribosome-binding protein aMBF1 (putative translation factor)
LEETHDESTEELRGRSGGREPKLARRAKMNAATVGLIETVRLQPYPGQLSKLARALGLNPEEIGGER